MGSNYSLIIAPPLYGVNLYCLVVAALPSICAATSKTTKESHIVLIAAITGIVALHFKMQGIRAYLAQQFIAERLLNIEKKRRSRKGKSTKRDYLCILDLVFGTTTLRSSTTLTPFGLPCLTTMPEPNTASTWKRNSKPTFVSALGRGLGCMVA